MPRNKRFTFFSKPKITRIDADNQGAYYQVKVSKTGPSFDFFTDVKRTPTQKVISISTVGSGLFNFPGVQVKKYPNKVENKEYDDYDSGVSVSSPLESHLLKRQGHYAPVGSIRGVLKAIADEHPDATALIIRRPIRFRTRNVITPTTKEWPFSGGKREEYYDYNKPSIRGDSTRAINLDRIRKGNHPYELEEKDD